MLLKEIGRKIAQAFRSARAADEKVASSAAAMLDAGCSSDEMASAILKVIAQKPEPLSHQTNNWRKMHGLPMHRKPASFRRRRKTK